MRHAWGHLDALGADRNLQEMADAVFGHARARRLRRLVALASTGLAAAVVMAVMIAHRPADDRRLAQPERSENIRVLASTVQRTSLPDGSVAELNGASRIQIDYTASERRIRLVDGEVHFIVEKDSARPFFVTAGPVTVRAVGTAFNIRLADASVEVLVTDGTVELNRAEPPPETPDGSPAGREIVSGLVQGQRAVISRGETAHVAPVEIADVGQPEMEAALGWQSTRLVFRNTPLDEVVEGFNRYNTHRLTLGDPRLRNRRLTGVFRADNLDGFVRLLRASVDVKADRRSEDETVLLPLN